ncbi:MAG: DUF2203 domain-containing protein [Bryobacterales bacterium]|nr:DUF2203 domain-containing protein [Bryobacterales bacterium]
MPRYFRLEEATRLLTRVAPLIGQAVALKKAHDAAEEALQAINRKVAMSGGMILDRRQLLEQRSQRQTTAQQLNEVLGEVEAIGCHVKDLDMGLIDFPSLYRGDEVCLCWRLGEKSIDFWHGTHEGFRGRKPIDADFLQHHTGGEAEV